MANNSESIGIGVLGLGRSGYDIHIHNIRLMQDKYKLVSVFDPLQDRADSVVREFGIEKSSSVEELINNKDVELVVIASPNLFHGEQACQALEAGKNVLCEKPFGLTLSETDKMIATYRKTGKVLQAFQQRRYEKDFIQVRQICKSGLLGEINQIRISWHGFKRRWDWQTMRACGGGALNNNGPHPIDHAMELFGEGEPEVWAEAKSYLCSGDGEDHLKVVFFGKGHPTIDLELSDVFAFPQDRWLVCGSQGGLRGTAHELEWKWTDFSSMPIRKVEVSSTPDRSYNQETLKWNRSSWQAEETCGSGAGAMPESQPVMDLYNNLYRVIREGAKQDITPENIRKRITVIEKIRKVASIPVPAIMEC